MKARPAPPADVRSHVGDGWFDHRDPSVGTADERNSYLFVRRTALQLKIVQERANGGAGPTVDRVADVRCFTENDETDAVGCRMLSALAANALVGRTLAQAAAMRDEDVAHDANIAWHAVGNGRPFLIADAVRAALFDWAAKATGRRERLPYPAVVVERLDDGVLTPFGRVLRALGL